MSNPWPERRSIPYGFGHKDYEDDAEYTVFLLQQLFVEMAELKAKVDKPLYQITVPPHGIDDGFAVPARFGVDDGDVNDHDAKRLSNSSFISEEKP